MIKWGCGSFFDHVVQKGQGQKALGSFWQMQSKGIYLNAITYILQLERMCTTQDIDMNKKIYILYTSLRRPMDFGDTLSLAHAHPSLSAHTCKKLSICEKMVLFVIRVVTGDNILEHYCQNCCKMQERRLTCRRARCRSNKCALSALRASRCLGLG